MPAPTPVPSALRGRPFTLAEAKLLGWDRHRLSGDRFRRLFHEVYVVADVPDGVQLRASAAKLILPGEAAFSHYTAAALRGVPVPDHSHTHVSVPKGVTVPVGAGLKGHAGLVEADVCEFHGCRLTSPPRTFLDLAPQLTLLELAILGDAFVGSCCTVEDIEAQLAGAGRRRGVIRARQVVPLLEPRTRSPMETRTRLVLVFGGLPRPEANRDVFHPDGGWLACPDLVYWAYRVAIEYDGDTHRTDKHQWRDDIFRKSNLEDIGWVVITLTADDVFRRPRMLVDRVEAKLNHQAARLGLPPIVRGTYTPLP